jgi:phosphatidylglycerophosphate synthase
VSEPAARWSGLHHGLDPAGLPFVRGWLRVMWGLAAPLVRLRVPPTAVTVAGAAAALVAVAVAGAAPWVALGLVLVSVVFDGLDGAVAVLADRATAGGRIADAVADRIADCAFAAVIWRCGAPVGLALVAAFASLSLEALRRRVGGRLRSMITVGERPSRTICAVLAGGCAGLSAATWPATVCAAVWIGLAAVGLAQLIRARPRSGAGSAAGGGADPSP